MEVVVKSEGHEKSRVEILPFINLDPSNVNTIYSALSYAMNQCEMHGIKTCHATFDLPLYVKAAEIVAASI